MTDSPRDAIARALLLADDGGNADAILAATEHAGDCPFVAAPAAYTCAKCQADEYRGKADAALAAIEASGNCIVPMEPTREMLRGYQNGLRLHIEATPRESRKTRWGTRKRRGADCYDVPELEKAVARYRSMLAARPRDAAPAEESDG